MTPDRCWIPNCRAWAKLIVYQETYGAIIGFCDAHRPELRVSVAAGWTPTDTTTHV